MKTIRPLAATSVAALILGLGAALPASAAPIVEDEPAYLTIHKYTSPVVIPPLPNDGGKLDDTAMAILDAGTCFEPGIGGAALPALDTRSACLAAGKAWTQDTANGPVPGVIFTAEQALSYGPFCSLKDDPEEKDLGKIAADCDIYGAEKWDTIALGNPATLDFWRRASYLADGTWDRTKLTYGAPIHGVTSADGAIGFVAGDGQWMLGATLGMTGAELNGSLSGGTVVTEFDLGLYRVTETYAPPEVSKSDPFFITLPVTLQDDVMIDTNLIKLGDWNYDVHVYPKNHVQDLVKTHLNEPISVGGLITYTISLTKPESVNHKICYDESLVNGQPKHTPIAGVQTSSECALALGGAVTAVKWQTRDINWIQFEDYLPPGLVLPADPELAITITPPAPASSYLWSNTFFDRIGTDPGYLNVKLNDAGLAAANLLGASDTITLSFKAEVVSAGIGTDGIMTNVATGTYKWDSAEGVDEFSYTTPPDVAYYGGERIIKSDISHPDKLLKGAEFMLFNECVGNATQCPDGAKTYAIAYGKNPVALASDYCSVAAIEARAAAHNISGPVCFYNAMDIPTGYVNISDTPAKGTEYQRELVAGALTNWHVKGSTGTVSLPALTDLQVTSKVFLAKNASDVDVYSTDATFVTKAATDVTGALLFNGINYKPAEGPKDMVILETKAPAGYELLAEPMIITIDSAIGESTTGGTWNTTVFNAQKNAGFPIPLTGSTGSLFLTVAGLVGFVAVVLVTSRKREAA